MKTTCSIVIALLSLAACSQPPAGGNAAPPSPAQAAPAAAAAAPKPAGHTDEPGEFHIPSEKFTASERAFQTAKESILKNYYSAGVTEDDLYRAAVQGMVEDVDARMHKWNRILGPSDLAEIRSDLQGEIVGIGVNIHFNSATGHADVLRVYPGSPAEKAGLLGNDVIVSVDGKVYKGLTEPEMRNAIRGKRGEAVVISALREDKLLSFSIKRDTIPLAKPEGFVFGDVGYVDVHMFSSHTSDEIARALGDLARKNVKSIVIDLRSNMGGSFDEAVKSAELFVPAGAPIVQLERRGGVKETITSKGKPVAGTDTLPLAVLVDGETSSGAELFTAALSEDRHAKVVGSKTFGKWSVQSLDELGNGFAIKYTTALFLSPSGKSFDGTGLVPDVEVDMDDDASTRACSLGDAPGRVEADVQLRTAISLLGGGAK